MHRTLYSFAMHPDRRLASIDLGLVVSNDGLHYDEPKKDFRLVAAAEDGWDKPPAPMPAVPHSPALMQGQVQVRYNSPTHTHRTLTAHSPHTHCALTAHPPHTHSTPTALTAHSSTVFRAAAAAPVSSLCLLSLQLAQGFEQVCNYSLCSLSTVLTVVYLPY
jgi:hypothetical protein